MAGKSRGIHFNFVFYSAIDRNIPAPFQILREMVGILSLLIFEQEIIIILLSWLFVLPVPFAACKTLT